MTTFIHARDNGYKNFWNIDADDVEIYAKPRRVAKMLKTVKDYAVKKNIHIFALDFWITNSNGINWSYGVAYIDNAVKWLDLMKIHCSDESYFDFAKQIEKIWGIPANADAFTNYLKNISDVNIETYYFENLYLMHYHSDMINRYFWGIKHWANGRCYWHTLSEIRGMGESGSLPIPEVAIKLDIGFTVEEYRHRFKNFDLKIFQKINHLIDEEIAVIFPLDNDDNKLDLILASTLSQQFRDFRLIVTDAGLNETALKTCREMESKFDGRMKIITGLSKENLFSAGLQAAKSRYVIFINGNDVFLPDTFKFLYHVAENTRADVVHTSNYFISNEGTASLATDEVGWGDNLQALVNLRRVKERIATWTNGTLSPSIYNKLIRREFLEEEKISIPFNKEISKWAFSLQCLLLAENYIRVPQPLYMRMFNESRKVEQEIFEITIKSLAAGLEAVDKIIEEVLYFDEYSNEKNLVKEMLLNLFAK